MRKLILTILINGIFFLFLPASVSAQNACWDNGGSCLTYGSSCPVGTGNYSSGQTACRSLLNSPAAMCCIPIAAPPASDPIAYCRSIGGCTCTYTYITDQDYYALRVYSPSSGELLLLTSVDNLSSPSAPTPAQPPAGVCRSGSGSATYTRGGTIHLDPNGNCALDPGENANLPAGISVTLNGNGVSRNTSPSSNGFYSFGGISYGTYNIVLNLPAGYTSYCRTRYDNVLVNSSRTDYNFGIQPLYTISGSVFNDTNKNYVKDTGEGKGTLGTNFSASGGSLSVNASTGTFTISNLYAGTYTVQYTSPLPSADFENRHPLNGPPQAFSVTVGSGCTYSPLHPVTAGRATCNARGDVSNLNFVVTDSHPWMQSVGLNIRIDSGFTNRIPAAPVYPAYTSIIDNLD